MAEIVRQVPWDEFLARGDLIGSTVMTEENVIGSMVERFEGVVVDVRRSPDRFYLLVESVETERQFEVGGLMAMMDLYELDDGSYEFDIPYLGTARLVILVE